MNKYLQRYKKFSHNWVFRVENVIRPYREFQIESASSKSWNGKWTMSSRRRGNLSKSWLGWRNIWSQWKSPELKKCWPSKTGKESWEENYRYKLQNKYEALRSLKTRRNRFLLDRNEIWAINFVGPKQNYDNRTKFRPIYWNETELGEKFCSTKRYFILPNFGTKRNEKLR